VGTLYVIHVPKNALLRRATLAEISSSKSIYTYPHTQSEDIYDSNGDYVGEKEVVYQRKDIIDMAIASAKAAWQADFTKDTWIVERDGTPVARISFNVITERIP
jgi:outer membrane lipoprotein-sorting protein